MAAKATDLRPLGLILVQRGVLTPDELDAALGEQADVGGLLGEILIRRGYASRPQITEALAEQYGLHLTQEVGFGSGLRSKIERRHEARRSGGDSENPDGAGQTGSPEAESNVLWLPTAEPANGAEPTQGTQPAEPAPEPSGDAGGEQIELLVSLLADRDATIAQLADELTAAQARDASVGQERARSAELASALERAQQDVAAARAELTALATELAARPPATRVAELEAAVATAEEAMRRLVSERDGAERALGEQVRAMEEQLRSRPTRKELDELSKQAEELRARESALRQDAEESVNEIERAREAAAQNGRDLSAAQEQLAHLHRQLEDARRGDRTADLQAALERERSEAENRAAELAELREQLDQARELVAEHERRLAHALADERGRADERARRIVADRDEQRADADRMRSELATRAEELQTLHANADEQAAQLAEAHRETARLQHELDERPADESVRERTAALEASVAEEQHLRTALAADLERERAASDEAHRRAHDLEQHVAAVQEELAAREEERMHLLEQAAERDRAVQHADALSSERDAAHAAAATLKEELDAVRHAAASTEAALGDARHRIGELENELGERPSHEAVQERTAALENDLQRERAEGEEARRHAHELEQQMTAAQQQLAAREEERTHLLEQAAELDTARQAAASAEAALQDARHHIAQLENELGERPTADELSRVAGELGEARLVAKALSAERASEAARLGESAEALAERDRKLAELADLVADLQRSLRTAEEETARLHTELEGRPTHELVETLQTEAADRASQIDDLAAQVRGLRDAGRTLDDELAKARGEEARLVRERDARPTVADLQHATTEAERATAKARELSVAVERQRAQVAEARSAHEQSQQALAAARARLERLEQDLECRPTIAMVEELQAALAGHAAREAAREAELEAVRQAAAAQVTGAQDGLAKQRAFANDLAATLYDTRVELTALRAVNVERTDALGAAREELAHARTELDDRPTHAQLAELRTALEGTLRTHQQHAERLSSTLRAAFEEAASVVSSAGDSSPADARTSVEPGP